MNVWKPWTGGECPVDPETVVEVRLASGDRTITERAAEYFDWSRTETLGDIIAYRVTKEAPAWKLPEPPEGMKWHREDGWTKEMLPEGYRPLLEGEELEAGTDQFNFRPAETWRTVDGLAEANATSEYRDDWHFRTARPLRKPKTYIPLEAKDVPPLSCFRHKVWDKGQYAVPCVFTDAISIAFGNECMEWTWKELLDEEWQILRPGSDWQPCRKEAP